MSSTHHFAIREEKDCVEVTPDDRGHVPNYACNSYYPMDPNTWIAVAAAVIFLLSTLIHIFLGFRHRAGYTGILITGAIWEFSSFGLRAYGSRNQQKKTAAIVSFLLFTLAPIWINAFVYMVASRLVAMFSPTKRVFGFSARWMSKLFIAFDILAFIVQLGGGLLISPGASASRIEIGLRVYQAGLGLQQASILAFVVLLVGFHLQMSGLKKSGWRDTHDRKWELMLYIEYITLALITARVAFRLAEYILPHKNNPLIENELYLYVLDALPMALCLYIYIFYHPGRVLKGPGSDFGATKAQMKQDKRARKMGLKKGVDGDSSDDEEERMIGVELQDQGRMDMGNTGYGGAGAYGPLPPAAAGMQHGGDMSGAQQQSLYDPYHGPARV